MWDAGRRSSCPLGACLFDMWDTSILGFQVGNFKVLRQEVAFCGVIAAFDLNRPVRMFHKKRIHFTRV